MLRLSLNCNREEKGGQPPRIGKLGRWDFFVFKKLQEKISGFLIPKYTHTLYTISSTQTSSVQLYRLKYSNQYLRTHQSHTVIQRTVACHQSNEVPFCLYYPIIVCCGYVGTSR